MTFRQVWPGAPPRAPPARLQAPNSICSCQVAAAALLPARGGIECSGGQAASPRPSASQTLSVAMAASWSRASPLLPLRVGSLCWPLPRDVLRPRAAGLQDMQQHAALRAAAGRLQGLVGEVAEARAALLERASQHIPRCSGAAVRVPQRRWRCPWRPAAPSPRGRDGRCRRARRNGPAQGGGLAP